MGSDPIGLVPSREEETGYRHAQRDERVQTQRRHVCNLRRVV